MRLPAELHRRARTLIEERLGLHFPETRHGEVERGILAGCRRTSIEAPEQYLAWLAGLADDSPEWRRLASCLTVGETYFFRDDACFEALEREILPALIAVRRSQGNLRLRLWSAACATGEEPYSLAILLDRLLADRAHWVVTILATDIDQDALATARQGLYREWSFRGRPLQFRDRYFARRPGGLCELDPAIRTMVTFAPLNLAAGVYPSPITDTSAMDVILCRNVLMYFTPEIQKVTVTRLGQALVPGGWLAVSPAEASAELFHPLVRAKDAAAIFQRTDGAPAATALPASHVEFEPAGLRALAGMDIAPVSLAAASLARHADVPPEAIPSLDRARALADQGDLNGARGLCEAVVADAPLDPEAHLLLAAICQELADVSGALEALRRAIYLAPDSPLAHFLAGSLRSRQGDERGARRALTTAVHLLSRLQRDEVVPGADGVTAGRLLDTARLHLEPRP